MERMKSSSGNPHRWNLLTNHGRVLAYVAGEPNARLKDIAAAIEITERTAQQIVNDLEGAGYVRKTRDGRRNQYALDGETKILLPSKRSLTISQVLRLIVQAVER
jgi:DNA-binding MarR family transcriptional regulator